MCERLTLSADLNIGLPVCLWMQILLQEQAAETKREETLASTTDPAERLRLETVVFAHERATASDRIIKMTEAHEQALEKKREQLASVTQLPPITGAAPK